MTRERSRSAWAISWFVVTSILTFSCHQTNQFASGYLELSYNFNKVGGVQPSYQTAIWLEDSTGKYLKTLFVSEFLSYGGYHDSTICPHWNKWADWENASQDIYDAVTQATPSLGTNILKIDCQREKLAPDVFRCCIEVHIVDVYNVLWCSEIDLGENWIENKGEILYIPKRHPLASNTITDVRLKYYP